MIDCLTGAFWLVDHFIHLIFFDFNEYLVESQYFFI